jgi:hypothetical protein
VRLADAFLDEIERKFSPSLIATDRVVGRATSGGNALLAERVDGPYSERLQRSCSLNRVAFPRLDDSPVEWL